MITETNPFVFTNEMLDFVQFDNNLSQTNLSFLFNDPDFQSFTKSTTKNVPNLTMEMPTNMSPWILSQTEEEIVSPLALNNTSPANSYFSPSHQPNHNIKSLHSNSNPPPVDPKVAAEAARQRNRLASRICRHRKRQETKLIELSLQTTKEANRVLELQVETLSQELGVIRQLLQTSCAFTTY